ncbi:MAG: ABC transporter ATP-binding protein [Nitrososphaerota archaeon]
MGEKIFAVEVKDLIKKFGDFIALKYISFNVTPGEIFGLIGPNGAGKTTTLRILATLLLPTDGIVKIFNYDIISESDKVRKIISYLAEDAGAYRNLSGYEYLKIVGKIYFSSKKDLEEAIEEAIKISGLGNKINEKVKIYSKGMKRRLQVARTFMVKPKLAILDEPTAGLDVIHAQYIRQIIKNYAEKMGVTIILSSHNMLEVENLCSRIAFIHSGEIVTIGHPKELKEKFNASNLEEVFVKVAKIEE